MAPTTRSPNAGLETLAYEALRGRSATHYRDLAAELTTTRGTLVNPVALLEVLRKARDLFLDLGAGRFRAVSSETVFDTPTQNLWLRLPPYRQISKDALGRDAKRLALARYVKRLPDAATLADFLMVVGHWRSFPSERQIEAAKGPIEGDALAERAAIDYIVQLARVSPQPALSLPVDVGSINRVALAARNRMIEGNLRLVADTARGYAGRGIEFFDLCQIGVVGLIRGIEKFDPDLGFAFSTYATWWLRQAMRRSLPDVGRAIRIPVHMYEKSPWLHKEHAPQSIPIDAPPTLRPILSLDCLEAARLPETIDNWLEQSEDAIQYASVHTALAALTLREREILHKRFGFGGVAPQTLDVIGKHFDVTRERIRQIESKAFKRLRHPSRRLSRLLPTNPEPTKSAKLRPYRTVNATEWRTMCLRYGLDGGPPRSLAECATQLGIEERHVLYIERVALASMSAPLADVLRRHKWFRPMANVAQFTATYLLKPDKSAKIRNGVPTSEPAKPVGPQHAAEPAGGGDNPVVPSAGIPPTRTAPFTGSKPATSDSSPHSPDERQALTDAMKRLTAAENLILTRRLGLDGKRRLSLQEIAYLYRYQDARVVFLQSAAIAKLGLRIGALVERQLAAEDV